MRGSTVCNSVKDSPKNLTFLGPKSSLSYRDKMLLFFYQLKNLYLQYESPATVQTTPTLLQSLSGKGIKQISAGVCHCVASTATLPLKGMSNVTVPATVPAQFTALRDLSCEAAYARLMLLNHFSKYISKSWPLFSANKASYISTPLCVGTSNK